MTRKRCFEYYTSTHHNSRFRAMESLGWPDKPIIELPDSQKTAEEHPKFTHAGQLTPVERRWTRNRSVVTAHSGGRGAASLYRRCSTCMSLKSTSNILLKYATVKISDALKSKHIIRRHIRKGSKRGPWCKEYRPEMRFRSRILCCHLQICCWG